MAMIEPSWGQSLMPSEERDRLGMCPFQGILEIGLCKELLPGLGWVARPTVLLDSGPLLLSLWVPSYHLTKTNLGFL